MTSLCLIFFPLQWRHNERDGVSNHQTHDCLLNRLFRRRSKKTSKPRVTGLCVGNSSVTGGFPSQRVSNAENVSIWWLHPAHTLHKIRVLLQLRGTKIRLSRKDEIFFLPPHSLNDANTKSFSPTHFYWTLHANQLSGAIVGTTWDDVFGLYTTFICEDVTPQIFSIFLYILHPLSIW